MFHLLSNRIFWNVFVNSKQPRPFRENWDKLESRSRLQDLMILNNSQESPYGLFTLSKW